MAFSSLFRAFSGVEGVENQPSTRMDFLRTTAKEGSILLLGSQFVQQCFAENAEDPWAFLKRSSEQCQFPPQDLGWEEVRKRYIPLGPNQKMDDADLELTMKEITPGIEAVIRKVGWGGQNCEVILKKRVFGVPDEPKYSQQAIDYFHKAVSLLYGELPGLERHPLEWTAISDGQNFENNFQGRVFIGKCFYRVVSVTLRNNDKGIELLVGGGAKQETGAFLYSKYNPEKRKYDWYFLFLPSTEKAITSVYSEVIPLTTNIREFDAAQEGYGDASIADETHAEAQAYHLGIRAAVRLKIPDGIIHVSNSQATFPGNETYRHVPKAIEWIRKNNPRSAFGLYMKDPRLFMEAIGGKTKPNGSIDNF
ncbi:hypothetical protein HYV84_04430 [Candidatus Woesearchaeota archaeon]|nr:hypothetical protein [Candidatus Woesearchaeota archaeon]